MRRKDIALIKITLRKVTAMKIKSIIAFIMALSMLVIACACTPQSGGEQTTPAPVDTTEPADDTTVPDGEETTEAPVDESIKPTDIKLSADGAAYRIVYATGYKEEAIRLFNAITELDPNFTAGKYRVTRDTDAEDGTPEIILGDTNRAASASAKAQLKAGLYYSVFVQDNAIAITAPDKIGISKVVDAFIRKLSVKEYFVVFDNSEGNYIKQYTDRSYAELLASFASAKKLPVYKISVSTPSGIETKTVTEGNPCQNCYSVTKLYCVTAIGMLYDEGKIKTTDTIGKIFKEELEAYKIDPAKWNKVKIHDVLRHRAGFDRGFLDIDAEDSTKFKSQDFLYLVLSEPLVHNPGSHYQYTDAAYYLISRVVTKISGQNLDDFLAERLFKYTDCREYAFAKCPYGYPIGATGLYIRSADVAKLGRIYLDYGKYGTKRIISKEWVNIVLKNGYELSSRGGGYTKGGMRGQRIYINYDQNIAVAWHSYDPNDKTSVLEDYLYKEMQK